MHDVYICLFRDVRTLYFQVTCIHKTVIYINLFNSSILQSFCFNSLIINLISYQIDHHIFLIL